MRMMRSVAIGLVLAAWCRAREGTRVLTSPCIQCHDPNSESHAPRPEALGNLPWQDILKALDTGSMKTIGAQLSAADKMAVARYLGKAGPATANTGLFVIDPATGKIVWNAPAPGPACAGQRGCPVAQKSPPTAIPGVVFSPSIDGHVRAHDTRTGEIIWDFDTAREFPTVNGIPAKGGSMAATGATVADGMLYVNSGYSSMPGNVLLAFSAN